MSTSVPGFRLSLVALALSAFAFPARAQAQSDTIVVTASRLPSTLDASTAPASVLTADDLDRRQTVFVADALASLPGVTVNQNGAFGGVASIRIRGAASEQTLVLIDGVAVNDPSSPGGGFNLAYLDAGAIERIEVLRGPQSTLWGSDAIGGVVNVVTKRAKDGFGGGALAEAGSFGYVRAGGSLSYGGERLDVRLGGVAIGADGISKADERDGNSEKDDYGSVSLDGRIGFDVTKAFRLEAFGLFAGSENDYDSFGFPTGVVDGDEVSQQTEKSGGIAAKLRLFDGRLENVLVASRASIERENLTNGARSFGTEGSREALRYQGTLRAADWSTIAFGAEREDSEIRGSGSVQIDGLFLLAEVQPIASLTLTAGVRRDDHSRFGEVTTARAGIRWAPVEAFGVRASWGQGFKAPTIFQLTAFFSPATAPNLDLQPEKAEGWDAAVFTELLDGRLTAEIGYFSLETENLINFVGGRYANIARAESTGIETSASLRVTPQLTLRANYTNTDAVNAVTGARLIRLPEHAAFVEADWEATPKLGFTATARYNGEEADTVRPLNPQGSVAAWTRLDLAGRFRVSEELELFARIENATDETYQDSFGYGTPGRSAFGGLRVRFS